MVLKPLAGEEAYGPTAEQALQGLAERARPVVAEFVEVFYRSLQQSEQTQQVLSRLTTEEFAHLRERQARHLLMFLEPTLTAEQHRARAQAVGRVHALVGVELIWLIEAYNLYQQALHHLLPSADNSAQISVQKILDRRLLLDLEAQGAGYRQLDDELTKVLVQIQRQIQTAPSATDLYRSAIEGLCSIDGISASFVGRAGRQHMLEIEASHGPQAQTYLDAMQAGRIPVINLDPDLDESLRGPTARAWHSGDIQTVCSFALDDATSQWNPVGANLGFRSHAVIPLTDDTGQAFAVVNVYSRWPGFFCASSRRIFLECLQQPLSLAAQQHAQGRVIPHAQRRHYVDLLRAERVQMLYQPIVDLRTGHLVKVEALARLIDIDGTLISPARFLNAFGSADLLRLFEVGIHQVCAVRRGWEQAGIAVRISLNLPPQGIGDSRYHDALFATIEQCGADPAWFEIEILESMDAPLDAAARDRFFQNLRLCGISVVQDDLGSGHSSLLRMESMPFDGVKIDQGLVLRASHKDPQRALEFIYHLTHLAHALKVPVTVEGLEHQGLIEAAAMLGADFGQGYGLARPMSADRLVDWATQFRYDVDVNAPRTPLGALAGYLLWDRELGALGRWPDMMEQFVRTPCMVQRFIERTGLQDPDLEDLIAKNQALAIQGNAGKLYQRTRQEVIARLSAAIRAQLQ